MTSVYSPRWIAPESVEARPCDMPGCTADGQYRAPKSRGRAGRGDKQREYHHFCLQHVKEYNQSWNYFDGMSDSQVERFLRDAALGDRQTWQRAGGKINAETLRDSLHQHFSDYFGPQKSATEGKPASPLMDVDRKTQRALAVLDLQWPVTEDEVKSRYKQLVKTVHPDINPSPDAEDRFKKITEAYAELTKAKRRKAK